MTSHLNNFGGTNDKNGVLSCIHTLNHLKYYEKICICGGGSLGHVIAGYLSANGKATVSILTNHPTAWQNKIEICVPDNGEMLIGNIACVSANPAEALLDAEIVLLCLPGFLIKDELIKIRDFINSGTYVGSVFSSTGFFFEALKLLNEDIPLWGFQRVPFISRIKEYGHSANLLGYKGCYHIAVERDTDANKELFRYWVENSFDRPVTLLKNYLEASLTNSNPLLHTARLYSMFHDWQPGISYPRNILFYEEWTEDAAKLLIQMDAEFFTLLGVLPVTSGYLPTILEYYESRDAASLARKLSSIASFKGIFSPMKKNADHWIPDFESRYFTEDFAFGLKYIWQLMHRYEINAPCIDKVYAWGISILASMDKKRISKDF